jgi:hypothetical protein
MKHLKPWPGAAITSPSILNQLRVLVDTYYWSKIIIKICLARVHNGARTIFCGFIPILIIIFGQYMTCSTIFQCWRPFWTPFWILIFPQGFGME